MPGPRDRAAPRHSGAEPVPECSDSSPRTPELRVAQQGWGGPGQLLLSSAELLGRRAAFLQLGGRSWSGNTRTFPLVPVGSEGPSEEEGGARGRTPTNDAEAQAPPPGLISSLGVEACLVLQPQQAQSCGLVCQETGWGSATNVRPVSSLLGESGAPCSPGKGQRVLYQ